MRKYLFLILVPIILSHQVYSQQVVAQISIDSCQAWAYRNYPLVKQLDIIEQSSEYNLSNASKGYLPQFDINLIGGVIDGFPSFSPTGESSGADFNLISILQLNQVIWDGGITKSNKNLIEARKEVDIYQVEVELRRLEERVNGIYFGIILIDEQLSQFDILLNNFNENRKRVTAAINSGVAFQSDLDELEVEVLNTNQKISELKYTRDAYMQMLGILVGQKLENETQLIIPNNFILASYDLTNRPETLLYQGQRSLLESKDKLSKSSLNPKVGLLGFGTFITPGVDFGASTLERILVAGVNVSWNIGGLYKRGNDKNLLVLEQSRINVAEESFQFSANLELQEKRMELDKYASLLQEDQKIIELKSKIVKSYEAKYNNGVATMNDLIQRMNDESLAKQSMSIHKIQKVKTEYELKTITGN